ncbi:methyltransferase type 11 [Basidiobolus meristosporus CBS 931.73]|uniref:Methyltransferase type 11 n=1 Tax=Basidiobolus meristosporus CBS 931.73 TaxID=1314790 RepID=A0A1Y1YGT8_9FUNG|nr:methyltransferase type 11 [Basidiobolus meristosporus CBS 931.73]|eukprot:ORX97195.1 methyltransferase type 11 [Basidiobolus meristosporus CBS 931.73]
MENRTYHNTSSPYVLPNDIDEVDRLNLQHYLFRFLLKGNSTAPVSHEIGRVLDVGCGSGIWSEEMSVEFANAIFDLVDISKVFHNTTNNPRLRFHEANTLKGLPFPDNTFDYSFQRLLVAGLTVYQWPTVVSEIARVTKPGGWVELVENDLYVFNSGPVMARFRPWFFRAMAKKHIEPVAVRNIGSYLQEAGLVNVKLTKTIAPIGLAGGKLDELFLKDYLMVLSGMKSLICKEAGISSAEFDSLLDEIEKECFEYESYGVIYVAYGQKPM